MTGADRVLASLSKEEVNAECVIVLGGDGTLVRAARDMAGIGVPLIGVNLGTLGYLCELDKISVFPAIDRMFEDQYEVEDRMMLEGYSLVDGAQSEATAAMNDIVIHRVGSAQIINLVIRVGGEYLTTYSADGVIISTPTGSTGYSMSAGGPIVDPKIKLLLITPINPQSFSSRSIVVGADAQIEVMLVKRRPEEDETAEVSFDGDRFMHNADRRPDPGQKGGRVRQGHEIEPAEFPADPEEEDAGIPLIEQKSGEDLS